MEAEAVLNLLDYCWFDLNLLKKKPSKTHKNPEIPSSNSEIPTLPTIHTKSTVEKKSPHSLKLQTLCDSSSASPNSVLFSPKLQTIFSGKETEETQEITTPKTSSPLKGTIGINKMRRKKKGLSKSLSSLEFEELKGFMDLGFVFSEEDKDSSLASVIPGLQRLGNKSIDDDDKNSRSEERFVDKSATSISRPYLSEAWDVLDRQKRENSLLNWRVPATNSEIDMKDYLRFWAHHVASNVR